MSFSYRAAGGEDVPVLRKVHLEIGAGEMVAIQGPSGSGKSTLLYIIGGLLRSYSGRVEIDGHDLASLGDARLALLRNRHMGFVFQHFHLLPKASVLQNVLLPSTYPAEAPARAGAEGRAERLLGDLGLSGRFHHLPNQLSGGQQQRVAIARALLNDTQIILADEPTGSLDSRNSAQIMEILRSASDAGRTVVVITHDPEVAQRCDRVIHFRDGTITDPRVSGRAPSKQAPAAQAPTERNTVDDLALMGIEPAGPETSSETLAARRHDLSRMRRLPGLARALMPLALESLRQNKSRSLLTMLGIVIGVAAVLSMVTLGAFTKRKILQSYAELGVNTLLFHGHRSWELRATDKVPVLFQSFDWERDLLPLKKVFPEIKALSPLISTWEGTITFGGKSVDSDARVIGVSNGAFSISNSTLKAGRDFSPFHLEMRSPVCVIGSEIHERLFGGDSPLGKIIFISQQSSSYGCRVTGVLAPKSSNKESNKPNLQVYLPYTYFQSVNDAWIGEIRRVLVRVAQGADPEKTGKKIKAYFEKKYGKSGRFDVGSDSVLIAQMNKFLSLFTILLGGIALVSLAVGGIGITNMMLVSVSERFKEIGIRKAFGATNISIRMQYLLESVFLCGIAGGVGLILGFILYQGAIYGATQLMGKLAYEWVIDPVALSLSVFSIFSIGVLSGLTPALKAERLEVIEALRSE